MDEVQSCAGSWPVEPDGLEGPRPYKSTETAALTLTRQGNSMAVWLVPHFLAVTAVKEEQNHVHGSAAGCCVAAGGADSAAQRPQSQLKPSTERPLSMCCVN